MPFFAAPKSSTARRAAATEPGPPMSAYRLDMSVRTPILITPSDTWAFAPLAPSARATAQLNLLRDIELPPWLNPEILLNAVHVRFQPVVRHHVDDAAMLHHVVAIGYRLREAEILLYQQQREPLLLEARQHAADLLHQHRCQALGRLIEQQQLRAGAQDAADGKHLLLAARELRARAVQPLLEVREQFVHLRNRHPARRDLRRQQQVLLHVQAREDAALLRTERDAHAGDAIRWCFRNFFPVEGNGTFLLRHHAHDRLERGRLARAVAPEQRHYL